MDKKFPTRKPFSRNITPVLLRLRRKREAQETREGSDSPDVWKMVKLQNSGRGRSCQMPHLPYFVLKKLV